ncbi:MAG: hypothetical protein KAS39_05940 [Actinomycetia bacterium]|nr:hypothetical protein [Actinomycetes bacterium]
MAKNQVTIFSQEDIGSYLYCNKLWELKFKKQLKRYLERLGSDHAKVAELTGTSEEAVRLFADSIDSGAEDSVKKESTVSSPESVEKPDESQESNEQREYPEDAQ